MMFTKADILTNPETLNMAINETFDFLADQYGVDRATIEKNFDQSANIQVRFKEMLDQAAKAIAEGLNRQG